LHSSLHSPLHSLRPLSHAVFASGLGQRDVMMTGCAGSKTPARFCFEKQLVSWLFGIYVRANPQHNTKQAVTNNRTCRLPRFQVEQRARIGYLNSVVNKHKLTTTLVRLFVWNHFHRHFHHRHVCRTNTRRNRIFETVFCSALLFGRLVLVAPCPLVLVAAVRTHLRYSHHPHCLV